MNNTATETPIGKVYTGINAVDFKKVIDKMIVRYGTDIVFEWVGPMRIVDFNNNVLNHIR